MKLFYPIKFGRSAAVDTATQKEQQRFDNLSNEAERYQRSPLFTNPTKKGQKHFMRLRSLRTPVDDDRWRRCQNEPKIQRKIPRWGSKGKYQNQENWMRRHTAIILAAGVKNLFF